MNKCPINKEGVYDVSVIIATYNCRDYIEKSVKSALHQESCNVEVIIVDDCSTDDTHKILSSIDDARIKYIKLNANQGASNARNIAIEHSTKEWVAILDADDWFDTIRLKTLIDFALDTSSDIVSDDQILSNKKEKIGLRSDSALSLKTLSGPTGVSFKNLLEYPEIGIAQPIFKRNILNTLPYVYNEKIIYGEDYDLLLRLSSSGHKFSILSTAYYYVLIRQGSLVSDRVKLYKGILSLYTSLINNEDIICNQEYYTIIKKKYDLS
ncbi:glycosyltransferase family 2 protein [Cobetia crustatorum]|uniref:glycosyltransferase family 2 protein n=1 Tax=Cobetia crustatorum TaxID=553385 RepID=UPI000A04C715|nr:glycosyltransferase family 2 protein [Cobetia crustatorum]